MKHLLTAGLAAAFLVGCVTAPPAPEPMAEGEEFHPTDALLIGGNGPFNAKPDAEDEVDLGLDGWSWW